MSVNPYQSLMTAAFRKTFRADFENPERPESGDHPAADLEFLDRFENGVLSDEERNAFLRHLETCPFCRKEIAFLVRTGILLPETAAEPEAPPNPIAAVQPKREKFRIRIGRHLNNRMLTATALLLLIIETTALFWPSGAQMVARRGDSLTLSPNAQKFALLIGIDDYANLSDLEYANNDVDAIENQLLAMGFDKGNIFKLSDKLEADKHPFRKNIEKYVEKVLRVSGKDDFLFLAFVGHGVKIANKVYFCPQDADVNAIKETAISMDRLTRNLGKSPAHLKWLNIDACRDDPFSGYRDVNPSGMFDIELNLSKKQSQKSGLVIFQSCSDGQRSKENNELQQGIFSYNLVEGLKKVAEKGSGTINDVYEYTCRQTVAMSEYGQTPLKIGDTDNFVIFDTPSAEGSPAEMPKNQKLDVGTRPGETRTITVNGVSYTFCWCPPGNFRMGSPETEPLRRDEETLHPVRLSHGFWMLQSEVTQEMWQSLMGSAIEDLYLKSMSDPDSKGVGPNFPICYVNWYEAKEFCEKLSEQTGYLFDLPTEAQWEYACRAGTEGPFSGSWALGKMGWYELNSEETAHEVKQKEPNAWGLYDIHGNVFEWCLDWFDEDYYTVSPVDDPEGPASGLDKVNRGGDFNVGPGCVRAAFRNRNEPQERFPDLGFRVIALPNSGSAKEPEAEAAPSRETEEFLAEVLPKPSRKHVLLVSVNDYDDTELSNLPMERNVFLIRDRLLDAGFKNDRIVLLSDASGANRTPTKETIEKCLDLVLKRVHKNDMFLFVFSGLGIGTADGGYLLPQDARHDDIQNTAISVSKLVERLRESPSRFKLMVLDTGREGETSAEQSLPSGLVVFQSCQEDEKALANDGYLLFSRCFADGLHGEADRDRNGEITLSELIRYTTERTEEMAKGKNLQQTPCVQGFKDDYVVANVKDREP